MQRGLVKNTVSGISRIDLRANGRNNSQHCCELLVRQMLDVVGSGVQTDATTPNIVGQVLGPADVGCCWQWCANGCNNSQHCWSSTWSGRCWMLLAVVYKRMQQLPTLLVKYLVRQMLDVVGSGVQTDATTPNIVGQVLGPADVRCCWQWCANGCNNL